MKEEVLKKINELPDAKGRISFSSAAVFKSERRLSVIFNSTKAQERSFHERVEEYLSSLMPEFSRVEVEIKKIVTEKEFVVKEALSYFSRKHRISCSTITAGDIAVSCDGDLVNVCVSCEKTTCDFCEEQGVGEDLAEYLRTCFADRFDVSFLSTGFVEGNADELARAVKVPPVEEARRRTLKVDAVTKLFDDDETDTATYISDTKDMLGEVYLAGTISNIRELETKTGKLYFIIDISDRTGMISGSIFPNKDKIPKIKKLSEGVDVIVRGEFAMRGEFRNLRIYSINLCLFPKNFVPVAREKKKVADEYILVEPKPVEYETQDNFLVDTSVPECFNGRTFVVFDLETTGTDFDDRTTEIGAVRIVDGKFTEYFTTLVNPLKHIPNDVADLTGIDDDMVKDAPVFKDICSDFYKFCYGATLVGHNVEFDIRFIRNESKPLDYVFENPVMDTLAIARECVNGVANYKLNTLCEKFGIKFRHHRAYSDAYATAELFVELIRIKGKMPF